MPTAKIYSHKEDRREILSLIDEILECGQLTLGKYEKKNEERFAAYVGVKSAIAVNIETIAKTSLRLLDVECAFCNRFSKHILCNTCVCDICWWRCQICGCNGETLHWSESSRRIIYGVNDESSKNIIS